MRCTLVGAQGKHAGVVETLRTRLACACPRGALGLPVITHGRSTKCGTGTGFMNETAKNSQRLR